MKNGYVATGVVMLVVSVPMLLYSLNGLSQFDNWIGQLARLSEEGQRKYNEWQTVELLSAIAVLGGIICLAYGMAAKNEIKHTNYNQA